MGERKGQNKYYPPDYNPKKGGLNKFLGTHPLRERARKINMGIIIVRFEMPYNIWCDGCQNHIGMGVRYNAEKTKVDMYYSTPVYKFSMKCHLCNNKLVLQTDPASFDYVIISGARRQENRWDPTKNEQIVPETKEVQKRLFDNAMFKLEHQTNDAAKIVKDKPRFEMLMERNRRLWEDNYDANSQLRAQLRSVKSQAKKQGEEDKKLLIKSSLDMQLLPLTDKDRETAKYLMKRKPIERKRDNFDIFTKATLPSSTKLSSLNLIKKSER